MDQKVCRQCLQTINDTYNRLIRDSCGHFKCRLCLLQETTQCSACASASLDESNKSLPDKAPTIDNQLVNKSIKTKYKIHTPVASNVTTSIKTITRSYNHSTSPLRFYSQSIQESANSDKSMRCSLRLSRRKSTSRNVPADLSMKRSKDISPIDDNNHESSTASTSKQDKMSVTKKVHFTELLEETQKVKYAKNLNGDEHTKPQLEDSSRSRNQTSNTEEYFCDACEEVFVKKSVFYRHLKIHAPLKCYVCDICDKTFYSRSKLIRHIGIHANLKPFKCTICDAKFSNSSSLRKHGHIHSGLKPHVCKTCGIPFRDSSNLRKHELKHTGTWQAFTCNECGKKYRKKWSLLMHAKSHTKDMTWKCSFCARMFYTKKDKTRHEIIHTAVKKFNCPICKAVFGRKDNLERHLRNTHGDESLKNFNENEILSDAIKCDKNLTTSQNRNISNGCLLHFEEKCDNSLRFNVEKQSCNDKFQLEVQEHCEVEKHTNKSEDMLSSENETRMKIIEANNKRKSVIFKSACTDKQNNTVAYKNDAIKLSLINSCEIDNQKNSYVNKPSTSYATVDCIGENLTNASSLIQHPVNRSDMSNGKKHREMVSVTDMYNRMHASETTIEILNNTEYSGRSEQPTGNSSKNLPRNNEEYIHKKVNYGRKKNLQNFLTPVSSSSLYKYSEFDDTKASWCIYHLSSKSSEMNEKTISKKNCTPASIELYKKILFPCYKSDSESPANDYENSCDSSINALHDDQKATNSESQLSTQQYISDPQQSMASSKETFQQPNASVPQYPVDLREDFQSSTNSVSHYLEDSREAFQSPTPSMQQYLVDSREVFQSPTPSASQYRVDPREVLQSPTPSTSQYLVNSREVASYPYASQAEMSNHSRDNTQYSFSPVQHLHTKDNVQYSDYTVHQVTNLRQIPHSILPIQKTVVDSRENVQKLFVGQHIMSSKENFQRLPHAADQALASARENFTAQSPHYPMQILPNLKANNQGSHYADKLPHSRENTQNTSYTLQQLLMKSKDNFQFSASSKSQKDSLDSASQPKSNTNDLHWKFRRHVPKSKK